MSGKFGGWLVVPLSGLLCLAGCHHLQHQSCCPPNACASGYRCAPLPPAGPSTPAPPLATTAPPGALRGFGPPVIVEPEPTWRPEPSQTPSPNDSARLLPPETAPPPPASPVPTKPTPPPGPSASPSLPVGIPQFAMAKKRVASGLRPILDGLDWLAANGYRTVLHVHAPGQDDSADRKQFEMRGLKYLSLEVSPETLSRGTIDAFNQFVTDPGNLPLFVYDRDGTLVGGLWYLHFRISEGATDEAARANAARLGLRPDQEGDGRRMWLAIQNYLSHTPNP